MSSSAADPGATDPAPPVRSDHLSADELASVRGLVASVRDVAGAAHRAAIRPAEWRAVAAELDALADRLGAPARSGGVRRPRDVFERAGAEGTPIDAAEFNPISPPVRLSFSADLAEVRAEFTLDPLYEGPLGKVHGGVISWLFDIALGALVQARQVGSMTRTLNVRYRRPTPLGEPLAIVAHAEQVDERTTLIRGELRHHDTVTAEGVGEFVMPRHQMPSAPAPDA